MVTSNIDLEIHGLSYVEFINKFLKLVDYRFWFLVIIPFINIKVV